MAVVGAGSPDGHGPVSLDQLRDQTWLLGPAAAAEGGVVPQMLRRLRVPEDHQRIFQSAAAALEETQRGTGVSLALSFVVAQDVAEGRLVKLAGPGLQAEGVWSALTMPEQAPASAVAELKRFVSTPRATQAMLRGSGVNVGHFKPSVHVTLWS